jgi:RHS repeat-associated protein
VGGLLAETFHQGTPQTCFAASDGSGNLAGLAEGAEGIWVARYEYGPFGELIRASGPRAPDNPLGFSTKYTDRESGFLYFGYRHYNPSTGRWLSRDPLGEEAASNLYSFVDNDGIDFFDLDGLEKGAEALVRMIPKQAGAFRDTPINLVTGLRLLAGLPFSFLSGDIFFNDIKPIPSGVCNVLISVNGIFTNRERANDMLADLLRSSRRYSAIRTGIAAGNRSTYFGDILQVLGDEFGAIQSASFNLARQINETYNSFQQNGCCCGSIQVFAHSQGTKVVQHARALIRPEVQRLICCTGIGGQTRVSPDGLANAENYRNIRDPVPYAQFLNPVNWPTQPFIHATARDAGGHGYLSSYADWVRQLQPNCPCTLIPRP